MLEDMFGSEHLLHVTSRSQIFAWRDDQGGLSQPHQINVSLAQMLLMLVMRVETSNHGMVVWNYL